MTVCVKNLNKERNQNPVDRVSPIAIDLVAKECVRCESCMQECGFLQHNGTPGQIAADHLSRKKTHFDTAYSCSICRLCTHKCPKGLPVAEMFLALRRRAVLNGQGRYKEHRGLLLYEWLGNSRLFNGYLLPDNCTTVFFPGCTLPGILPEQTYRLFALLRKKYPELGIVFDCCNKPSHDLGFQDRFESRLQRRLERLRSRGVTRIITACPSCFQIFNRYGECFEVTTAYTHLECSRQHRSIGIERKYTLHDPCTVRFEPEIQRAVRQIIRSKGIEISEMPHNQEATICCGEGGSARCIRGGSASDWSRKRKAEVNGLPLLTFCAGCTLSLKTGTTIHVIDLLFDSPNEKSSSTQSIPAPFTYFNRLLLKMKIAKDLRHSRIRN
ncbi:MAG: (Fe-S)-binding protein [Desulforhopalus sp.]